MAEQRKQHLYLVFDDWNSGYSIRKLSLSRRSFKRSEQSSDSREDSEQSGLKSLPVFFRIRAPRGYPRFFASAFGTKIMALHSSSGDIPTIDVQEHTISFETPPNGPLSSLYIPVSDEMLFALDLGTFEVLRKPEPTKPSGPWMWQQAPRPPFPASHVLSYGVQPDGCILVSIRGGKTFIFDTKQHVWKQYGQWVCHAPAKDPAEGQHVSATFVHMRQGKFCIVECVCTDNTTTDEDDTPRFDGYAHMGGRPQGGRFMHRRFDGYAHMGGGPQGGRFMYRVKTFNLSYDTKGDLKLRHCKVRCYNLPHEARIGSIRQNPVAFWL